MLTGGGVCGGSSKGLSSHSCKVIFTKMFSLIKATRFDKCQLNLAIAFNAFTGRGGVPKFKHDRNNFFVIGESNRVNFYIKEPGSLRYENEKKFLSLAEKKVCFP